MIGTAPAHWWIDSASGAAPLAVRGIFAAYVELNPRARQDAETLDLLGAILLEDAGPGTALTQPSLTDRDRDGAGHTPARSIGRGLPSPLQKLGYNQDRLAWRSRLGGIRARRIDEWCEPGVDARLFRFDADAGIPLHDHKGEEFTLVLEGGYFDAAGLYHRGDMAYSRNGFEHEPRALPDEACICLTVSIGGYRFRNPLVALAARLLT